MLFSFLGCFGVLPTDPIRLKLPLGKGNALPFHESWALQCLRQVPECPCVSKQAQGDWAPSWDPPWAQELFLFPPVVSATNEKGCTISLCRCSPHQRTNCLFPPHQCWFTRYRLYVVPQKEKHRINGFDRVCARHFAAHALAYDQSG